VQDTNAIIHSFLITQSPLKELVSDRIYCPKLPQNCVLPALSYNTRGGKSDPYIPTIVTPSVQFSCWGNTPIIARQVYGALYDALQGLEDWGSIASAIEEVQGQDMEDPDVPNFYKVITFFSIMIRV